MFTKLLRIRSYLKVKLFKVLFPVVGSVYTGNAIGSIETYTEGTLQTPTTHVELTGTFIGENDAGGTEDIRVNVKFTPGVFEIVNEGKIEFVCTRRVGETGAEFLEEVNLAIYTNCGH